MPESILGDGRRFKQVLINLVKNALKFTRTGSIEILTSYDKSQEMLFAQIKDTGNGIAKEDLGKLFNRFGKLTRTANMNQEGIGLGLTIVKNIIESSKGDVRVYSKGIGHGAYFCFSMKMAEVRYNEKYESPQSGRSGDIDGI